jgi:hypothetical protein
MPYDPPDHIPLEQLLIYEDDELLFDASDPSTYTVIEDADHLRRELAGDDIEEAS